MRLIQKLSTACLISTPMVSATLIHEMNKALESDPDQLFKLLLDPGEEYVQPVAQAPVEKDTVSEILAQVRSKKIDGH